MVSLSESLVEGFEHNGFAVIDEIYTTEEVESIIVEIDKTDQSRVTFRKTEDLFAIRRFLKEIPAIKQLVFNENLKGYIDKIVGKDYFVVKSIYFDKPEKSNWFVGWHQYLTISIDKKSDLPGYGPWTIKPNQFAVQPPQDILQNNFTVRIHLDDTDKNNGALNVIVGSHKNNISRVIGLDLTTKKKCFCSVKSGGIMLMRPLLWHASNRTTNDKKRRVIHIEFSKSLLPSSINWAEKDFF